MDLSNRTAFNVQQDEIEELRTLAQTMTVRELAEASGISYGKLATILRLAGIKAKRPEVVRKHKEHEPKMCKKDHTITSWAQTFNNGRIRYVYYDMIRRCYKETDNNYKDYGGRGIRVCDAWKKDCCNFYKWAKDNGYEKGLQLDRMDNNGDYCPENCHWVSPSDNAYNKRNTRLITYKGETKTLRDWARETGISKYILADRIYKYGWEIERALTQAPK